MIGAFVVFALLTVVSVAFGLGLYSLVRQEAAADRTVTDRASAERAARRDVGDTESDRRR